MGRKQLTNETFIERAKKTHGDKFCYSSVVYSTYHQKINIACRTHGDFYQSPAQHIGGKGCPRCAGRKTQDQFIEAAANVHGTKYDYSEVFYTRGSSRLTIVCPAHGPFQQVGRDHLQGNGCAKCAGYGRTTEDFIETAIKLHGLRYDYSRAVYSGVDQKVEILCSKHGSFQQSAYSHMKGNGCPKCSSNTSKAEHLWLDSLGIPDEYRHKSLKVPGYKRTLVVDAFDPSTKTVYEFYGDLWHGNPSVFPQDQICRAARSKGTYGDLFRKTVERENRLLAEGYNLVTIWEKDWNDRKIHVD